MTLCGQTSTHEPHSQQLPYCTTSFIICLKLGCIPPPQERKKSRAAVRPASVSRIVLVPLRVNVDFALPRRRLPVTRGRLLSTILLHHRVHRDGYQAPA